MRNRFLIFAGFVILFFSVSIFNSSFASSGDWEVRCAEVTKNKSPSCEIFQRLVDGNSKSRVAEMAVTRNLQAQKWNITLILPLGIHIPSGVAFGVDGKAYGRTSLNYCEKNGCILSVDFTEDLLIDKMKAGAKFNVSFKNISDKTFNLGFSLKGFSRSVDQLL